MYFKVEGTLYKVIQFEKKVLGPTLYITARHALTGDTQIFRCNPASPYYRFFLTVFQFHSPVPTDIRCDMMNNI